jgi:hypothetical protein
MNTMDLTNAALALDLTPAQMEQQADLARRLLSMAILGTPTTPDHHHVGGRLLSLHALSAAFAAIATTHPEVTDKAAFLTAGLHLHLVEIHQGRMAAQAVRRAADLSTPTNQPAGATHGE